MWVKEKMLANKIFFFSLEVFPRHFTGGSSFCDKKMCFPELQFYSIPNDKILESSELKALADD